ncbi:hypothetical protein PIB30_007588 [Stylosanthes scabra]|uniref:Uncharacterized protein n=1 Tax=Stylosanthes scabra TaxID=79078 RepID=A0ABU6U693_9FABA|nr:hypothetical protein [Stylosanthes scabra]
MRIGNSFRHPKVGWVKDTIKRESEGWNPLMRRRMLARKIPRKRSLLHFPCLWTSILTEDCLRCIEGLRRRPELSPLRSKQVSVSDSPRSQLIDSLPTQSMVSKIGVLQKGDGTVVCEDMSGCGGGWRRLNDGGSCRERRREKREAVVSEVK